MAMTQANAICIERGTAYGPEYFNRLYSGVRRNLSVPVRFFCMTEIRESPHPEIEAIDLPDEPWLEKMNAALAKLDRYREMRKVSLFRPELISDLDGPLPGFDLYVAIKGPLDPLSSTLNQRGYDRATFWQNKQVLARHRWKWPVDAMEDAEQMGPGTPIMGKCNVVRDVSRFAKERRA